MKILIDTNIILEIILRRECFDVANHLLSALQEGEHKLYITSGGFYGLLFTTDKYLRKVLEMENPRRTDTVRSLMTQVLNVVDVAGQDKQALMRGIHDMGFKDLQELLGREVDLVEEGSLRPYAAESANRDKLLIYERKSEG